MSRHCHLVYSVVRAFHNGDSNFTFLSGSARSPADKRISLHFQIKNIRYIKRAQTFIHRKNGNRRNIGVTFYIPWAIIFCLKNVFNVGLTHKPPEICVRSQLERSASSHMTTQHTVVCFHTVMIVYCEFTAECIMEKEFQIRSIYRSVNIIIDNSKTYSVSCLFHRANFYRAMHVVLARYCYRQSSVSPSVRL